MALTNEQRRILKIALADRNIDNSVADTIADMIDSGANPQGAAVADLSQDVSGTYVESEVQAISDKVDELLGSLRAAGIIAS